LNRIGFNKKYMCMIVKNIQQACYNSASNSSFVTIKNICAELCIIVMFYDSMDQNKSASFAKDKESDRENLLLHPNTVKV